MDNTNKTLAGSNLNSNKALIMWGQGYRSRLQRNEGEGHSGLTIVSIREVNVFVPVRVRGMGRMKASRPIVSNYPAISIASVSPPGVASDAIILAAEVSRG